MFFFFFFFLFFDDDDDVFVVVGHSVPPYINLRTSTSSNIEAKVSETVAIKCHVTGIPTPTVRWLVNGQPLDRTDQRYYISRDGGTIKISDLQVSDTGRYTCIAKNSVGFAERDFNLDVLGTSSRHHTDTMLVLFCRRCCRGGGNASVGRQVPRKDEEF